MEISGPVIITGATGAIGSAAVAALAARGTPVVLACRNRAKAETLRSAILARHPGAALDIRDLDLASAASVRRFADGIAPGSVSALFNNAGVIPRGYALTPDGLESSFAVNYYGPWLLTTLLADKIPDGGAIVNMVSLACRFASIPAEREALSRFLQPEAADFCQLGIYAAGKRALLSFSLELARRQPRLRVNVSDPGIVASGMINLGRWFDPLADFLFKPLCKSPEKGARPALGALASPERFRYFVGKGSRPIPPRYDHPRLDGILWDATATRMKSLG